MNEQNFSKALRPWLDASAQKLSFRTVHRLELGRKAAIKAIGSGVLSSAQATASGVTGNGNTASLTSSGDWSLWNKLTIAVSALVLVGGMYSISAWHAETDAEEAAAEDVQLLTDDLPLTAYADHGFGVYMKNTRSEAAGR